MSLLRRLFGGSLPAGVALDPSEHVLASSTVDSGGALVATSLGLWVPDDDGARRIGWHLIAKAVWSSGVLTVTESAEVGEAGEAVLIADLRPVRFPLGGGGRLPAVVQARVTGSIKSRDHRVGAWFVQRKVPGRDGIVLQVRADPDADLDAVHALAAEVAARIAAARAASS